MKLTVTSKSSALGLASCAAAMALGAPAQAQTAYPTWTSAEEVKALPADMRSAPVYTDGTETIVGPGGVETIVRTRRIDARGPAMHAYSPRYAAAPIPVVEREQWIDECRRRTSGYGEDDKGRIIGGLLGAVAGGFIGNRVAGRGDRLAGTLIGAGAGGIGGAILGDLVGGGKKDGSYDCAAALDGYLAQYREGPVYQPPAYPAHYGYAYTQACGCGYAQPQMTYIPVRYEQKQRVVVRETVREETYVVPGRERIIDPPAPVPSPKMIKR